jgi:hypothetical protein
VLRRRVLVTVQEARSFRRAARASSQRRLENTDRAPWTLVEAEDQRARLEISKAIDAAIERAERGDRWRVKSLRWRAYGRSVLTHSRRGAMNCIVASENGPRMGQAVRRNAFGTTLFV